MSTNDLLQKLRKLLSETADTTEHRQPWQELFSRETSIPSRAIRATEAVRGFAGSWAASYTIYDGFDKNVSGNITPVSGFNYQLGQRGYPEINFVPYDWNTNRFGKKGPSLVGHPVSFEVVGATHKTYQHTLGQEAPLQEMPSFKVNFDKNHIEVGVSSIQALYGNIDENIPTWILITEMGGSFSDQSRQAGVDDQPRPFTVLQGIEEMPKYKGVARYELFRVTRTDEKTFALADNKPLKEYFYGVNYSEGDTTEPLIEAQVKSIMLLQPKVARLAAIKDSSGKTFAVLPPERTAVGEYQLPYSRHISSDGLAEDYNRGVLTPNPKPVPLQKLGAKSVESHRGEFFATMEAQLGDSIPKDRFRIKITVGVQAIVKDLQEEGGALLHIQEVIHPNSNSRSKDLHSHSYADFTGYFEIVDRPDKDVIECRYLTTADPETGYPKINNSWWLENKELLSDSVQFRCTLHRPVGNIHSSFNSRGYADDVEASRLTGIIDPNEVGRSVKVHGTNDVPLGGYAGRPDRAIPNTQLLTDPGSLLDLGFRMVFYTLSEVRIMEAMGGQQPQGNSINSGNPFVVAPAANLVAAKITVWVKQYNDAVNKDAELKKQDEPAPQSLQDEINDLVAKLNEIAGLSLKPYDPDAVFDTLVVEDILEELVATGLVKNPNPYLQITNAVDKAIVQGGIEYWIDWEKPIASNEVILNPNITDERQYLEVDYSAGIVKFSHTPQHGGDFVLDGNGNAVLFAAFVPYSMEGGQRSVGVRMTGGDIRSANLGYPKPIQRDVFGKETAYPVWKTDVLEWGSDLEIELIDIRTRSQKTQYLEGEIPAYLYEKLEIPTSGYFSLSPKGFGIPFGSENTLPWFDTHSTRDEEQLFSYDGYEVYTEIVPNVGERQLLKLRNVRSNALWFSNYQIREGEGVVFRKRPDIKSFYDRNYGSSARTDTVRFAYGDISYNEDGSMTVLPTAVAGPAVELRAFYPFGADDRNPTEIGRFHLDPITQRWTTDDPPWYASGHEDSPNKINEIGLEVSRGRLYTHWDFAPDSAVDVSPLMAEVVVLSDGIGVASKGSKTPTIPDSFELVLNELPHNEPGYLGKAFVGGVERLLDRGKFLSVQLDRVTIVGGNLGPWSTKGKILKEQDPVKPEAGQGPARFALVHDLGTRETLGDDWAGRPEYDGDDLVVTTVEVAEGEEVELVDVIADPKFRPFDARIMPFEFEGLNQAGVLGTYIHGVASFSGRQVCAFPAKSYLVSQNFEYPLSIPKDMRLQMSLRHVLSGGFPEPQPVKPSWLNMEVRYSEAAVTVTNAQELAEHLNRSFLYGMGSTSSSGFEAEHRLEHAGFNVGNGGGNPAGFDEHCMVFVAWDDPRFPTGADKSSVALIYSGYGGTYLDLRDARGGDVPTPLNFYPHGENTGLGVIIDVSRASTAATSLNPSSLNDFLRGDFAYSARIGGLDVPRDEDRRHGSCNYYGNLLLGFPDQGTRPVGSFLGEFKIDALDVAGDGRVNLRAKYPTGANSDWYNDQSSYGEKAYTAGIHTSVHERWLGRNNWDFISQFYSEQAGHLILGRGDRPFGENVGEKAGVYRITTLFGLGQENESNSLRQRQYSSHLYLAEIKEQKEWVAPENLWNELAFGDLVETRLDIAQDTAGTSLDALDTDELVLQGRIVTKSKDATWFTFLARSKNGYRTDSLTSLDSFAKNSETNLMKIRGENTHPRILKGQVRITPSLESGTNAAVGHFLTTTSTNNEDVETQEEHAFFGGSTFSDKRQHKSAVFVGAGRVSLLSTYGSLEPTGITLHNLMRNKRQAYPVKTSTYIESGAFTTFVGGGGDSRGFYGELNLHRDRVGRTVRDDEYSDSLFAEDYPSALPQTKELKYGGVGGVRVSGDAHIWLENITQLKSDTPTAYIGRSESPVQKQFTRRHTPTSMTTMIPGSGYQVQEVTVVLGLTTSDWGAIKSWAHSGHHILQTVSSADTLSAFGVDEKDFKGSFDLGNRFYSVGQNAKAAEKPLIMPSLVGNYIALTRGNETYTTRIVGTPMVKEGGYNTDIHDGNVYENHSGVNEPKHSVRFKGRHTEAQFAAILAVRVEMIVPIDDNYSKFPFDEFRTSQRAWRWAVYRDAGKNFPVFTGDVVDPGGAPTGARSSVRGMTLDPQIVAGKSYLAAQLVPFVDEKYFRSNLSGFDDTASPNNAQLLGIHDQVGRHGKHFSRAFFAVKSNEQRATVAKDLLPKRARIVVLADALAVSPPNQDFHKAFSLENREGKVDYLGHPRRLGPGVIMDGGLGLVQANAFRARPRPRHTESLGNLTVFGRGAYPLPNMLYTGNIGSELPSVFNTSEFYGEVSIANPQSRIVIESPNAAEGLVANMLAAEFMTKRHRGSTNISHYVHRDDLLWNIPHFDYEENASPYTDTDKYGRPGHENPITRNPAFGDTLFPHVSSGIVFRSPGTTVYERAFRSLDATGTNPHRKANEGTHNRSGIAGMGVPFNGEVLLLPQGPSDHHHDTDLSHKNVQTPMDAPLYDFVNAPPSSQIVDKFLLPKTVFAHSRFSVNLMDVFRDQPTTLGVADREVGIENHWGQPGLVQQAYRHSNSREDVNIYRKNVAPYQVRLLDGMVLEDVTNGTFYTVGAVGRDFYRGDVLSGLGLPGDGSRSPVNGSMTVGGHVHLEKTYLGNDFQVSTLPEALYDMGPLTNLELGANNLQLGFGDRADRAGAKSFVRRPLTGHRFRITPNVEFVPVLGPRGVQGGLMPPIAFSPNDPSGKTWKQCWPETMGGDALFYDLNHEFKDEDLGKMLYVCGTDTFAHTGWYTIIEVMHPQDDQQFIYFRPQIEAKCRSAVILRRNNWAERAQEVPLSQLPALVDKGYLQKPSKKVFPLSNFSNGGSYSLFSTGDQFNNAQPYNQLEGYGHFVPANTSLVKQSGNFSIIIVDFEGVELINKIDYSELGFGNADSAADAAQWLNNDPRSNGKRDSWMRSGQQGQIQDYDQWIFWYDRSDCLEAKILPVYSYNMRVQGHRASVQILWKTRGFDPDNPFDHMEGPSFIGFGYCEGHNLGQTYMNGDANNAGLRPYRNIDITDSDLMYREAPARGLRWVFSHPLTEENVGSYVHLTKTPIYRFGQVLESQKMLTSNTGEYEASWTSGHVQMRDVFKNTDLATDIYRINRCPNTGKIILGGDCEIYYPEFNHSDSNQFAEHLKPNPNAGVLNSFNQPVIYSPLGIHGNWPVTGDDMATEVVGTDYSLNFPAQYYLQPIAREKIVTVSPSNASSSMVFGRGLSDKLGIPQGPQGVGSGMANGHAHPTSPTAAFGMTPWQLVSRADMTKTTMAQSQSWAFDSRVELNNSDLNLVNVNELHSVSRKILDEQKELVAKLETALANLNDDLVEIDANGDFTVSELETNAATREKLTRQRTELYATVEGQNLATLEAKLANEIAFIGQLDKDLSILQEHIAANTKKLETAQNEIQSTEAYIAKVTMSLDSLTDEATTQREELEASQSEIRKHRAEYEQLNEQVERLTVDYGEDLRELQELDINIDWKSDSPMATWRGGSSEATVRKLVDSLQVKKSNLNAWKRRLVVLETVVLGLEKKYKVMEEDFENLERSLAEWTQEKVLNEKNLAVLKAEYDNLDEYLHKDADNLALIDTFGLQLFDRSLVLNDFLSREGVSLAVKYQSLTAARPRVVDARAMYKKLATDKVIEIGMDVINSEIEATVAYGEKLANSLQANTDLLRETQADALILKKELNFESNRLVHLIERELYWEEAKDFINENKLDPLLASKSDYIWTPAGQWWQLYQPSWDEHGPDASAPPPTLRVDITESFTQAIGPGSGLNSPHPNRFPRGVRLNRMWVNFGVWGNEALKSLNNSDLPGMPKGVITGLQSRNMVLDEMYVCFNLILEIPGSQARVKNTSWRRHRPYSGNEAFPMGGRMPTAAVNHDDNLDEVYPGGTIVVPLYVNREAGDMMPNIMERFVTVGPKNGEFLENAYDWSAGDYEFGFGCSHTDAEDPSFFDTFATVQPWVNSVIPHDKDAAKSLFSNSFNPVVWGGIDFARKQDGGPWYNPRHSVVQASIFSRQSRLGGGLRSKFTSGLIPDGSVFSDFDPHSLSAATMTGITIAHTGQMPSAPAAQDGSYTKVNTRGGQTCPHGFTVALTPIGDGFVGNRAQESPNDVPVNMNADYNHLHYGRQLESPFATASEHTAKPFKVGNWLEQITKAYGIYSPSGSMLPPGSRVFLEISVGPGPAAKDQDPESKIGAGAWVGSIKLGFDVETVDGTAWTADVNVLGDEEG